MANRNWASGGKIYSMHVSPVLIDCKFTVNSSDAAGNGIINLKGPAVSAVYMNTSATPSANNPNPEAGVIVVQLADGYNLNLLDVKGMWNSPLSGSDVKIDNSALTVGNPYVISTLGNATAAKWKAIGVPAGITPAVGVAFIAKTNGGTGNTLTSMVQAPATHGSTIAYVDVIGNPSLMCSPNPGANQGYGASFILGCFKYDGSLAAPPDNTEIHLAFYMNNSSITVQGE